MENPGLTLNSYGNNQEKVRNMEFDDMKEADVSREKMVIGITGGVGSGKSRILEILKKDYGAEVILADDTAKELMEPGQPGLLQVIRALGNSFIREDGTIDRPALADLIFRDDSARQTVNDIIHPLAWEAIKRKADESEKPLVIVETAIVEEKMHDICQEIWYVYTSRENRILRLMENRGYTREKCEAIMESQWSDSQFRAVCQKEIDNNGPIEETESQIRDMIRKSALTASSAGYFAGKRTDRT